MLNISFYSGMMYDVIAAVELNLCQERFSSFMALSARAWKPKFTVFCSTVCCVN